GAVPAHVWGPLGGAAAVLVAGDGGFLAAALAGVPSGLAVPALILALAYLSVSLDESGFFEWFASRIMALGRGSGRRLLLAVFLGVSVVTFFTSNDIVIVAMTPAVMHLGHRAGIRDLRPFLLTLFVAANTASM